MSLINNYKINEFALDDFDEEGSLMIPKKNMGGAFKAGVNNSYTEMQLAAKDGFKLFNQDNYRVVNIRTRASEEYFRNFFTRMAHADKKLGIIKIDVEGMELSIIRRIGATIPMDFGVIIFFEHLSNSIDRDKLLCEFKGRKVSLYSLDKYYKNFNYFKRLIHFTLCLIKNRVKYSLVEIKKDVIYSNDLVLKIE